MFDKNEKIAAITAIVSSVALAASVIATVHQTRKLNKTLNEGYAKLNEQQAESNRLIDRVINWKKN